MGFGADGQTSGITPSMSMNTFEIYESLMSIDSRKNVYLIRIQLKTFGLCQKKLPPPPSRNIDEMESNVQQAWQQSADMSDHHSKIHLSMRQHCVAVIRARNGHTRY